jgi:hypothetical protein
LRSGRQAGLNRAASCLARLNGEVRRVVLRQVAADQADRDGRSGGSGVDAAAGHTEADRQPQSHENGQGQILQPAFGAGISSLGRRLELAVFLQHCPLLEGR